MNPDLLETTMCHEHLHHQALPGMFNPRNPDDRYSYLKNVPFDPDNLWWINFHPYSHRENLIFDDVDTQESVLEEMKFYKVNGGSSIVEATTFGRDLKVLKAISEESGVNIIAGTGFYVNLTQSESTLTMKVEEMYEMIKSDLFIGDSNGTKCGIIGELGTCFPLHEFERKVLMAAGNVSRDQKSVPVSIHPGRDKRSPEEDMRVFLEAGGNRDKVVMCHLERTFFDDRDLLDFASQFKTFLEFDLFGIETSYYELSDTIDMPSDAVRVNRLKTLIDEGYGERIVISMDIHTKQRLMAFGGHGFSHILLNTVPMMRRKGFTETDIQNILVNNPKKWLTINN